MSQTENLRTEGRRGLEDLCKLARKLGYKDRLFQMQLSKDACVWDLLEFLEDNSGAIEAIYEWIDDNFPDGEDEDE
jgi:hypothetical protein